LVFCFFFSHSGFSLLLFKKTKTKTKKQKCMARAPSVLIVQTNQQDGNKAQILWKEAHRWGKCSATQGGGTTSRCCHSRLSPLTWGGMNFAPRFESSWFLPGCPSPGEQILACGMLGKSQVYFVVMTHLPTQNWAASEHALWRLSKVFYFSPMLHHCG